MTHGEWVAVYIFGYMAWVGSFCFVGGKRTPKQRWIAVGIFAVAMALFLIAALVGHVN